jgi:hypothetical protein
MASSSLPYINAFLDIRFGNSSLLSKPHICILASNTGGREGIDLRVWKKPRIMKARFYLTKFLKNMPFTKEFYEGWSGFHQ